MIFEGMDLRSIDPKEFVKRIKENSNSLEKIKKDRRMYKIYLKLEKMIKNG